METLIQWKEPPAFLPLRNFPLLPLLLLLLFLSKTSCSVVSLDSRRNPQSLAPGLKQWFCCVSWLEKESSVLGTQGWSKELLITVRLKVLRVGNNMDKQSFRLPQRDPRRNNFEKFTMSKLFNTRELTCCFREGNGTPFQYSCLENPMDRSLVGCSPWGRTESDTTEQFHFHFSLSCIGEGNGNPLQCSCLENPVDGGAWWAAVYGVAQSRTRLKWLSSSSSSCVGSKIPNCSYIPLCFKAGKLVLINVAIPS